MLAVNDNIVKHGVDQNPTNQPTIQTWCGPQGTFWLPGPEPPVAHCCLLDFCSVWAGQPHPLQAWLVCVGSQNSLHDGQPLCVPLNNAKLLLSPCLLTWWTHLWRFKSVTFYSGEPFLITPGRLALPFSSCVMLDRLINFSVPWFPYLWNGDENSTYLIRGSGGLN